MPSPSATTAAVAATVRSPGCAPWSLVGELAGVDVRVAVLVV